MPSGRLANGSVLLLEQHVGRLGGTDQAALGASTFFQSMLRDLKLVNSHLATIDYASLDPDDRTGAPIRVTSTGDGANG